MSSLFCIRDRSHTVLKQFIMKFSVYLHREYVEILIDGQLQSQENNVLIGYARTRKDMISFFCKDT